MRGDLPGWLTAAVVVAGFLLFTCLESARPLRKRRESRLRRTARKMAIAALGLGGGSFLDTNPDPLFQVDDDEGNRSLCRNGARWVALCFSIEGRIAPGFYGDASEARNVALRASASREWSVARRAGAI